MNSAEPGESDDGAYDPVALNFTASKLDVYQHERLAYTEIPARRSKPRPISHYLKKWLATIYH